MTGTVLAALIAAGASLTGVAVGYFKLKVQVGNSRKTLEESISAQNKGLQESISSQTSQLRDEFRFEGRRDRREIYAAALAALKKFETETERTQEAETTARIAVGAVELVARPDVRKAACDLLEQICINPEGTGPLGGLWDQMLYLMRKDIGVDES